MSFLACVCVCMRARRCCVFLHVCWMKVSLQSSGNCFHISIFPAFQPALLSYLQPHWHVTCADFYVTAFHSFECCTIFFFCSVCMCLAVCVRAILKGSPGTTRQHISSCSGLGAAHAHKKSTDAGFLSALFAYSAIFCKQQFPFLSSNRLHSQWLFLHTRLLRSPFRKSSVGSDGKQNNSLKLCLPYFSFRFLMPTQACSTPFLTNAD